MKPLFDIPEPPARDLPPLEGSPKQVAWAEDIRKKALRAVTRIVRDLERYHRVLTERGDEEKAEAANRRLARAQSAAFRLETSRSAKWWIDHREMSADELVDTVRL